MTVTVNATATTPTQLASGTSTTNTTLTIAASATSMVAFLAAGVAITSPSVRWDSTGTNQTMTLIATAAAGGVYVGMFGLLSPTTGAHTLAASWTTSGGVILDAIAFNGTATDTIANAFQRSNSNTGSGTSGTVTGTSAVGNINLVLMGNLFSNISSLSATGSTSIFTAATNNGGAASRATGAATVAWTGTQTTDSWAIACIDVCVPASGATSPVPYQPWYQLAPVLAQ